MAPLYVAGGVAIAAAPFAIGALGEIGIARSSWVLGIMAALGLVVSPFLRRALADADGRSVAQAVCRRIGLFEMSEAVPRGADRGRAFAEDDILAFRGLADQGGHPVRRAEATVAVQLLGANDDRDTGVLVFWMIAGPERVR